MLDEEFAKGAQGTLHLCISTPQSSCLSLSYPKPGCLVLTQSLKWSCEVFQEKSTKQHPIFGGLCTKGWSISPPALGWILIQEQSAEPGNSCCLPCDILPGWSHFWKMFFSLNCCPNPEEERKAAEFKAKEPVPCRNTRRREQSCAVVKATTVSSGWKAKFLMANSMGSVHRPQSTQKSRISGKDVLISFGIYNSFLWSDRGSCPDGNPWKHNIGTH